MTKISDWTFLLHGKKNWSVGSKYQRLTAIDKPTSYAANLKNKKNKKRRQTSKLIPSLWKNGRTRSCRNERRERVPSKRQLREWGGRSEDEAASKGAVGVPRVTEKRLSERSSDPSHPLSLGWVLSLRRWFHQKKLWISGFQRQKIPLIFVRGALQLEDDDRIFQLGRKRINIY